MALIVSMLAFFTMILALRAALPLEDEEEERVQQRLRTLSTRTRLNLRGIELSAPIWERIVAPPIRWFLEQVSRRTSRQVLDEARLKLDAAGNPWGMKPATFIAIKALLTLVVPAGLVLVVVPFSARLGVTSAVCMSLAGYSIPEFALARKKTLRDKAVERDLPDALDLLTVSVEAGLGFDSALARVAERMAGPVGRIFDHLLAEMRLGKPRREALRELGRRTGVHDLATVASAIVQADQLGINISSVLRIQSDLMRTKRRQRAEEAAMKAPIKMVFPLVIFIFPALFVILLGPAIIQVVLTFSGR